MVKNKGVSIFRAIIVKNKAVLIFRAMMIKIKESQYLGQWYSCKELRGLNI